MNKLNFGCGTRVAEGWVNIDFTSGDPRVQSVNLLKGLPFPDNSFDAVYSSHVLEHFTKAQAAALLNEARRVLKPGGILRIVVPDFENICTEYFRVISLPEDDARKPEFYKWVMIEMLDQMTRMKSGGEMRKFYNEILSDEVKHAEIINYVRQRATFFTEKAKPKKTFRWLALYLKIIKHLIPRSLRPMVYVDTYRGERHQWMYDRYGMALLVRESGFAGGEVKTFDDSRIPGFNDDRLDCNADGTPYKHSSLYFEAVK